MLSTTDFEKLLFLYKTEGKNMSAYSGGIARFIHQSLHFLV
jgi:hypothetical protein